MNIKEVYSYNVNIDEYSYKMNIKKHIATNIRCMDINKNSKTENST